MIIKDNYCILAAILNESSKTQLNSFINPQSNKQWNDSDSNSKSLSSSSKLIFKEAFNFKTIQTMKLKAPITSLFLTRDESHLLIGLSDGKLIVITGERAKNN